jgi:hypothetical protein
VISGGVTCVDTLKKVNYPDVFITVTDTKSGEIYGNYSPNPNSGRYVIILPPGQYNLSVEAAGFKSTVDKLVIADKGSFKKEIPRDLKLSPEGTK